MGSQHIHRFTLTLCCGLLCTGALSAQEVNRFVFDLGGGFTQTVGNTGRYLNDGWNVQGGAGINFTNYVGALVQLDYNSLGFNGATLGGLGYPSGDVHVFSATVDPIVHLTPRSHFDLYAIGGGGLYHWYQQFGAPASGAVITPFASGSFPITVPTFGQAYSENKPGWNAGMGVAFGTKWHGKIFAEARYVHIFLNNNERADYIPVTFGFRW
jgi:hypothetical protein